MDLIKISESGSEGFRASIKIASGKLFEASESSFSRNSENSITE